MKAVLLCAGACSAWETRGGGCGFLLPPTGDALAPIPPRGVLGGGDLVGCSLLPSGSSYTASWR